MDAAAAGEASPAWALPSEGVVVDAAYTLGGDKVATCSSSGAVQVWACDASEQAPDFLHLEQVQGTPSHLAWSHPDHGLVLAVGTDRGVCILQGPTASSSSSAAAADGQQQQQRPSEGWCMTSQLAAAHGAVSALAFAPRQHGLVLAVACQRSRASAAVPLVSGGSVLIYEAAGAAADSLQWTLLGKITLSPAAGSCSCLCWREAAAGLPPLLVGGHSKGGCIWAYSSPTMEWQELASFCAPPGCSQDALAAVHWAPALGRPHELVAAAFGDTVAVLRVQPAPQPRSGGGGGGGKLAGLQLSVLAQLRHPAPVWRLEFNILGNTLACSLDDRPEVWLWMPSMDGVWKAVTKLQGREPGGEAPGDGSGGDMVD